MSKLLIMNYCCVLKEWPFISDWSQLSESLLDWLTRAKLVFWPCTAVKWTSKDELDAKNGINNKNKQTNKALENFQNLHSSVTNKYWEWRCKKRKNKSKWTNKQTRHDKTFKSYKAVWWTSVGEQNAKHLNQFQQVQTFLLLLLLLLQLVSPVSSPRTQPGNQFGFGDCEGDW